jgi:hypothetical protein
MTFSAGKVTTRLVDGKVILRTREMDCGDEPEGALICLFEGCFTRKGSPPLDLNKTASLGISLLD